MYVIYSCIAICSQPFTVVAKMDLLDPSPDLEPHPSQQSLQLQV